MATLEAQGLCKSYRDRQVVSEVTLRANDHEVVGLLGPNGAGKTTCFYMITGLVPCDQGQILLDGHAARWGSEVDHPADSRQRVENYPY